jgi:hypothetical protein
MLDHYRYSAGHPTPTARQTADPARDPRRATRHCARRQHDTQDQTHREHTDTQVQSCHAPQVMALAPKEGLKADAITYVWGCSHILARVPL